MTQSNAELREALIDILNGKELLGWTTEQQVDELLAVFQAREQQLLTELLGELPEKPKRDDIAKIMTTVYEGDNMARAYRLAIDQVVSVIERLQNKTNDGGRDGASE